MKLKRIFPIICQSYYIYMAQIKSEREWEDMKKKESYKQPQKKQRQKKYISKNEDEVFWKINKGRKRERLQRKKEQGK